MKTFNIKIDYRDLLPEEEANKITDAEMLDAVKEIIATSILSGLSDHSGPGGQIYIRGTTVRMADYFLDILDASEDGTMIVNDKRAEPFQELWTGRLQRPQVGYMRKLIQRIDRRICPDEYKGGEEAPAKTEGTPEKVEGKK